MRHLPCLGSSAHGGGLWYRVIVRHASHAVATALSLAMAVLLLPACTTLPAQGPARGLYVDLRKSVDLSANTGGWVVDRVEIESQAGEALRSVCRVQAVERERLRTWLNGQLLLEGGSARAIYERTHDLSDASDALTLERVRALLDYAELHSEEDCPFWLAPEADFPGVEGDAERLVFWLESMGGGSVVLERSKAAIGGGGGGRVLGGYGIGSRLTLAIGAEVGGHGSFVDNGSGARTIETTFTAALPVVLRITDIARIYDFEVAPVMRLDTNTSELPPGVRVQTSLGFTTARGSVFMPYVALYVGYEVHPAHGADPMDHSFHLGTRVGVDADP